jgi:NET1-associated nuclear protein 1 (U3 small nucleolar RNA-associated protein 17)
MFVLLTAACCSSSKSEFAVLSLLSCHEGGTPAEQDGVILLFDAENSSPVSSFSVKKVCSIIISHDQLVLKCKIDKTMQVIYFCCPF